MSPAFASKPVTSFNIDGPVSLQQIFEKRKRAGTLMTPSRLKVI
jgi:hypothetical protein